MRPNEPALMANPAITSPARTGQRRGRNPTPRLATADMAEKTLITVAASDGTETTFAIDDATRMRGDRITGHFLIPRTELAGSDLVPGFEVIVGGGLGRTPMIGKTLREFLPKDELTVNYCGQVGVTVCPDQVNNYADGSSITGPLAPAGTRMPSSPKFKGNVVGRYEHAVDAINAITSGAVTFGQRLRVGVGHTDEASKPLADAIDDDPLDSRISETARIVYAN